MNGLGFRPLRYEDGTGPEGVETPGMTHENAMHYIRWIHGEGIENLPPSERMGLNSFKAAMEAWLNDPRAAIDYATRLQNLIESPRPVDTMGLYPTEFPRPSDRDLEMGGNLGRMTVPSVSRPSGRDLEMMQNIISDANEAFAARKAYEADQLRAMQGPVSNPPLFPQGMAHGGYASRGTVAGELPRYGDMSVREEGETMQELSKRHRDQDWYNRMSGGLGSLGRRVA